MAASTTNKSDYIRFNSGNLFLINTTGTTWIGLGHIIGGKLSLKRDKNSIVLADGETVQRAGKREASLQIILAQTDETVQDQIMALISTEKPMYYYNGVENGKHQEYYFPRAEILESFDIDMKGQSHQAIALDIVLNPAVSGTANVPQNSLPEESKADDSGVGGIDGSNPYYVVIDTSVS